MKTNFTQQHVLVVGDGTLFDESVISLLTTHGTGLLVSHAIYSDDQAVLNTIKEDHPDVILVSESRALDITHLLDLVSSDRTAMALPVVVARFNANVIDVYQQPSLTAGKPSARPHRIITRTRNDLLKALRKK